jgi:hypothetical protein
VSWDLAFWRPAGPAPGGPAAVYAALIEDGEPDGVAWLPVSEVQAAFRAAFPGIADNGTGLDWEGAGSYFQVSWRVGSEPRHTLGVFVSCGWSLLDQPEVIERVRAVGLGLGCGVFDPQAGEWSPPK